jgi:hypothetical protein
VIGAGLTATSMGVSLSSGHTYRYAVRAHDRAGNVGAWKAGPTTSEIVRQDNSGYITYGSGWRLVSASGYSGGTVHDATAAGSSLSYTLDGRSVALVSTIGPGHGQVRVYVDGVYTATVDTVATTTADRRIVWTHRWASAGWHTVRLVVVGTSGRPRVDLDAFVVLR